MKRNTQNRDPEDYFKMKNNINQSVMAYQTRVTSKVVNPWPIKNFSEVFELPFGISCEFKISEYKINTSSGSRSFGYPSIIFRSLESTEQTFNLNASFVKVTFRIAAGDFSSYSFSRMKPLVFNYEYRGTDDGVFLHPKVKKFSSLDVHADISIKDTSQKPPKISVDDSHNLEKDLSSLLADSEFADFRFKVHGCEIPAHKAILAARSSFFEKIFTSGQDSIDEITDVSVDAFKQFLHFLYTDDNESLDKNIQDLLALAVRFEMDDLKNICSVKLESQVNDQNAIELFSFGNRYNLTDLKLQTFKVIQKALRKLNQSLPDETINEPEKVVEAAGLAMKLAATVKEIKTSGKKDGKSLKNEERKEIDGKAGGRQEKVKEGDEDKGKVEEVEVKDQEAEAKIQEAEAKDQEAGAKDQEAGAKDQEDEGKDQEVKVVLQEIEAKVQEEKIKENILDEEVEAKEAAEVTAESPAMKEVQETPTAAAGGGNDATGPADPECDRDVVIESIHEEPPTEPKTITVQTPDNNIPEPSAEKSIPDENSQDKKKKKKNKKREAKKNARGDTEISSKEESTTDNE